MSKPKLNKIQKANLKEYNKQIGILKRQVKAAEKRGYVFEKSPIPEPPTRTPTKRDIKRIEKLRKNYKAKSLGFVNPKTGELIEGKRGIELEKELKREKRREYEKERRAFKKLETEQTEQVSQEQEQTEQVSQEQEQNRIEYEYINRAEAILANLLEQLSDSVDNRFTAQGLWRQKKEQAMIAEYRQYLINLVEEKIYGIGDVEYAKYINSLGEQLSALLLEFESARYEAEIVSARIELANCLNMKPISLSDNITLSDNDSWEELP